MVCDNGTPGNGLDDMVLDKKTGLIWARYANLSDSTLDWITFVYFCRNDVTLGNRKGWRPPTMEELQSLIGPDGLPPNNPFMDVQNGYYWTSTTLWDDRSNYACIVNLLDGSANADAKLGSYYLLPVYGGKGYATGNW